MSQADDLLNTLVEETMTTRVSGDEPHIVVNADRTISVPEELMYIASQYDHNIETVTFDCPRYWDSNDMSTMDITIVYTRPDGEPGEYTARNIIVDDDVMHFDWIIERHVTEAVGNISIQICVRKVNNDTVEEKHWSSFINDDMYISQSLPHTSELVIDDGPKRIIILTDQYTGVNYELYVQDGYLKMTERM